MAGTLLIAFGFASPWLLWGLALGAAPIIIHLLNKRKFREMEWAAMRFLLAAVRKNSRRLRIEQLVLLAVRTAILMLLAVALAQPLVEQLGAFFQASQPSHKILILDASLSMAFQPDEQTLFDRAKEAARAIVEAANQGDAFNVARLSELAPALIVSTPAYQSAEVIEEIEQMPLPHARANLVDSLEKAAALLEAAPDLPQKEIYLISDFQRATWTPESSDEAARLRAVLRRFDEAGSLVLLDLGQPDAPNAAVSHLEAVDPFATTARSARFRAAVRNFGSERLSGRVLEFLVDDKLVEQRTVDLAPGAESEERFAQLFSAPGEHRVQVRLQGDGLGLDDQRWLAVPVRERIKVLCVSGHNTGGTMGKATDFLELALSPAPSSASSARSGALQNQIEPTVISEGELPGVDLMQYDCVFFCNVRMFTEREAQAIESYLKAGGGVVWCLGDQVRSDDYNAILYRQGEGILPARLGDRQGNPERPEEVFDFDPGEYTHPIVAPFQGNPDAGLQTTQTYAYIEATIAPDGPARVALTFHTGDPAIVEAPVGRGRSLLVTTSVDDRWGIWPLWPSFVPLVHEVVLHAVSGRWSDRQRLVGEALSELAPSVAADQEASVQRPDGQVQVVRLTAEEGFSAFEYDATDTSGVYEVSLPHPLSRTEWFAVNVDPRESNLAKHTEEELTTEVMAGVDFSYHTSWQGDETAAAPTPVAERGGLTRWLLYAVLYLLLVEQMLAWDFRRGLWLLCPLVPAWTWLAARRR